MAGQRLKYRHLSRSSSHRQALLRNLVTSLINHESIHTTWPKAKEAQRLAEKLITLGKRNTNAARSQAQSIFFTPERLLPKLFGTLRERYATRPGGYTRVLRTEPRNDDAAPSAILELVDGPKDMRFAFTARALARQEQQEQSSPEGVMKRGMSMMTRPSPGPWWLKKDPMPGASMVTPITRENVKKVTMFRENGEQEFRQMVDMFKDMDTKGEKASAVESTAVPDAER